MALVLTEEQEMLRDAAKGWLADNAPVSQLRKLRDTADADGFDRKSWKEMAEMGWAGVLAPEEHGGVDMGYVAAGLIAEEMGRTLTASPYLSTAVVATTALNKAGTQDQQAEWLPKIVSGDAIIALAIDEERKHNPAKTALKAERHGNGFKLNGAKTFVADGHVADAYIVAARTAGAPGEADGLTLFLVNAKTNGIGAERTIMVDSRNSAEVKFDNVEVTADAVLGEVDAGHGALELILNAGRAGLAAEMSGSAQECFERTSAYLAERKQFGQTIGAFQALQHRAAHLYTEVELARSTVLKALQVMDEDFDNAAINVSLAKAKAGQVALLAAQEGIQMHGGIGMTDEYEIGFFIKRVRAAGEMFGDANYHADQLARLQGY
ncbi:MAG: acyl-CoA dehydrogenase family protein [Maricaulaceae bacterium]|jgi:alkylation response protein AidB-like acyl-CoA dehydrogenase